MNKWTGMLCATLLLVVTGSAPSSALAGSEQEVTKSDYRRSKIDTNTREALDELFAKSKKAKSLYKKAVGYAVFTNTKVSIGLTGSGGTGVAINKNSNEKIYMKMGSGGIGFGLGAQKYQVVFLFQDDVTFKSFIEKGWSAETAANAAAGTAGVNAAAGFINGMAIYQMTDGGLMLQADISGTKYWKDKKLNGNVE